MHAAEGHVATERASRYLVQLCEHIHLVTQANPQMPARAEWSDDRATISLGPGRCVLRAEPSGLSLRAEAPDTDTLDQLKHRVAGRLEQIGRRDGLTVQWVPPASGDHGHDGYDYEHEPNRGIPRWVKVTAIIVVLTALLVVIMLLVGGGHAPRRHG